MPRLLPTPPEKGFYYHNPSHKYWLDSEMMTGVTTVLGIAGDKTNLIQWAANQAAVTGLLGTASIDALAFAAEVAKYKKIDTTAAKELDKKFPLFKTARTAHIGIRDTAADTGKEGHSICEEYELAKMGQMEWAATDYRPEAYERAKLYLNWYENNVAQTHFVERPVFSRTAFVAGTPDGGFELKDGRNLINDKKFKPYIYDPSPFWQMGAYRMMLEEMATDTTTPIKIDWGQGRTEEYASPLEYLGSFGAVAWDGAVILRVGEKDFEEMHCDTYEDDKADFLAALRIYRSLGAFKNRLSDVTQ